MAKGSVGDFNIPGLDLDREYFTDADIDRVIEVVGLPVEGLVEVEVVSATGEFTPASRPRRDALKERLNNQARWHFGWERPNESRPSLRQEREALEGIQNASRVLLGRLLIGPVPEELPDDVLNEVPDTFKHGHLGACASEEAAGLGHIAGTDVPAKFGTELLREAIQGVYRLRRWSAEAEAKLNNQPNITRRCNAEDVALNRLIDGLLNDIWVPVFGQSIGTSTSHKTGAADGPLVRFVEHVLNHLDICSGGTDAIRSRIRRRQNSVKRA